VADHAHPPYAPPTSWGPVQVIPPGLLGALQLKQLGQNPHSLLAEYRPTIEVRDWLLLGNAIDRTQISLAAIAVPSATYGAANFSPNHIIVPTRELWWCYEYTVSSDLIPAGDTIQIAPSYSRPLVGTLSNYVLCPRNDVGAGAVGVASRVDVCARNFWLPPDSELGFTISTNTRAAGNTTFLGYLRYTPIPI